MTDIPKTNTRLPLKVLFLDFDGVMHPDDACYFLEDKVICSGGFRWAPKLVSLLKSHPGWHVVISSMWRCMFSLQYILETIPADLKPFVLDTTDPEITDRYHAICAWINKHKPDAYIAIDDAVDEFPKGCTFLLTTRSKSGLSSPPILDRLNHSMTVADEWCEIFVKSTTPTPAPTNTDTKD